jgi:hypothetical protein
MAGLKFMRAAGAGGVAAAAAIVLLTSLAACSSGTLLGSSPEPQEAPPPAAEPPPVAPPPVDVAGRWQLSAAAGGSCFMTFGGAPNAAVTAGGEPHGPIAPEGGCPGNFFTSRKWTFEDGALIIRDFKGRPLAHLSYVGGHFEGQDKTGGALTLSRQQ